MQPLEQSTGQIFAPLSHPARALALALALAAALAVGAPAASAQTLSLLFQFKAGPDGSQPFANVILDSKGNLYGTTTIDGEYAAGTVFKVSPSGFRVWGGRLRPSRSAFDASVPR